MILINIDRIISISQEMDIELLKNDSMNTIIVDRACDGCLADIDIAIFEDNKYSEVRVGIAVGILIKTMSRYAKSIDNLLIRTKVEKINNRVKEYIEGMK